MTTPTPLRKEIDEFLKSHMHDCGYECKLEEAIVIIATTHTRKALERVLKPLDEFKGADTDQARSFKAGIETAVDAIDEELKKLGR